MEEGGYMPVEILIAPAAPVAESASDFWKYGLPVVSLVAGILLKWLLDLALERRRDSAQEAKRLVERRDALKARRVEAERANLITLLPLVVSLLRAGRRLRAERTKKWRDAESYWYEIEVDPEIRAGPARIASDIVPIRARLHSEKVRAQFDQFINSLWHALSAETANEASSRWVEVEATYKFVAEAAGDEIRRLEDEEFQMGDSPAR